MHPNCRCRAWPPALAAARQRTDRAATRLAESPDPRAVGLIALIRALTRRARGDISRATTMITGEIARTAFVSVNTVKTHVRGVLRKLGVTRRSEAVRHARDLGLL